MRLFRTSVFSGASTEGYIFGGRANARRALRWSGGRSVGSGCVYARTGSWTAHRRLYRTQASIDAGSRSSSGSSIWGGVFPLAAASAACALFASGIVALADAPVSYVEMEEGDDEDDEDDEDSEIVKDPSAYSMRRVDRNKKKEHLCSHLNKFCPECDEIIVLSGNAYPELAESVAKYLGKGLCKATIGKFNDGESNIKIDESVRGKDVYIIQPTGHPVNDNLMELLLMISTCNFASAKRVTAIIPYFGYQRSSGETVHYKSREKQVHRTSNLACADVARMLESVKLDRLITFDMQPPGQGIVSGFFSSIGITPVTSVKEDSIVDKIATELAESGVDDPNQRLVVVANHSYCITMAQIVQKKLKSRLKCDVGLGVIMRTPIKRNVGDAAKESALQLQEEAEKDAKRVPRTKMKARHSINYRHGDENVGVLGDVRSANVLVVDDILDTGTSLERASEVLHLNGANHLFLCQTTRCSAAMLRQRCALRTLKRYLFLIPVRCPTKRLQRAKESLKLPIAPIISELIRELHYIPKK